MCKSMLYNIKSVNFAADLVRLSKKNRCITIKIVKRLC